MSKLTLTGLALPLFLLFASPPASAPKAFGATTKDCRKPGAERDTSEDDCRKRKRHDGSRSQPFEWNQLRARKTSRHCNSPLRLIPSSPFWFLTIFCEALIRGRWHSCREAKPFRDYLCH